MPSDDPVEILRALIRFDTTNPPGNEAPCIAYIGELLNDAGIGYQLMERTPGRPNLVARIRGRGEAPPLLLYGHVDVVTTAGQDWRYPPFAGELVNGYVWGRGALDMKGGVAMLLAAILRARKEGLAPPGDIILAALCDEENGGADGARFLVERHAHLFEGVRYAIGEFGGFSIEVGQARLYPVMVAEKQSCRIRATIRGPGGHASMPVRGGATARLGRMLTTLDRRRLPVHVLPVVRQIVEAIASKAGFPGERLLPLLLRPALTDRTLDLLGAQAVLFDPLLHNTVTATIIRGGEQINVIPSEITVDMDCRLLPGFTPDDILRELQALLGNDIELEASAFEPGPPEPDLSLFPTLAGILREADPSGTVIPLMLPAVTDARFFCRLGIQTYGFLPMPLPPEMHFTQLTHAANERIPAEAVRFGTNAIYTLLERFGA